MKCITKIIIKRSAFLYIFIGHLTNLVFSIDYEEDMSYYIPKVSKKIIEPLSLVFLFLYFIIIIFTKFWDLHMDCTTSDHVWKIPIETHQLI